MHMWHIKLSVAAVAWQCCMLSSRIDADGEQELVAGAARHIGVQHYIDQSICSFGLQLLLRDFVVDGAGTVTDHWITIIIPTAEIAMYHVQVLLFTDKAQSTVLYKALSLAYVGRLRFAEVRPDAAEVVKHYKVDSYPTLVIVQVKGEAGAARGSIQLLINVEGILYSC